jgi:hypothetical protein
MARVIITFTDILFGFNQLEQKWASQNKGKLTLDNLVEAIGDCMLIAQSRFDHESPQVHVDFVCWILRQMIIADFQDDPDAQAKAHQLLESSVLLLVPKKTWVQRCVC